MEDDRAAGLGDADLLSMRILDELIEEQRVFSDFDSDTLVEFESSVRESEGDASTSAVDLCSDSDCVMEDSISVVSTLSSMDAVADREGSSGEEDGTFRLIDSVPTSPTAFDRLIEALAFFSDNEIDPDELDRLELVMREEVGTTGVIDLCSDSDSDLDDLDSATAVTTGGVDAGSTRQVIISIYEAEDGFVTHNEFETEAREHKVDASTPESTHTVASRGVPIVSQAELLDKEHNEPQVHSEVARRTSEMGLTGTIRESKRFAAVLREDTELNKRAISAFPDETKESRVHCSLSPYSTSECIPLVYSAYTAVKELAARARAEASVHGKWSIKSWVSLSRLSWSATRFPDASPAVSSTVGVNQAWRHLIMPDEHPQQHRTVLRVEEIRKMSDGIAVVKRTISIAPWGVGPARMMSVLSVVFLIHDSESLYIGLASLPESPIPASDHSIRESSPKECQSWIFPSQSPTIGETSVRSIQYVGYYSIDDNQDTPADELLERVGMDVGDALSAWESRHES